MELDDFKNTWNDEYNNAKQQNFTFKTIDQMTQKKYNSKIRKIAYPEIIGSVICLMSAVFIGIHFYKLDTAFLKGVGIISILLLLILTSISFLSILQLNRVGNVNKPYAETLKMFATQKLRFYQLQKLNITLSYLLLITVIVLLSKFFGGKDITGNKYFWTFSFSLGYIFLLLFSTFVSKFYKSTLRQTEELLQEL